MHDTNDSSIDLEVEASLGFEVGLSSVVVWCASLNTLNVCAEDFELFEGSVAVESETVHDVEHAILVAVNGLVMET